MVKRYDFDPEEAAEDMTGEWIRWADHKREVERLEQRLRESEIERKALIDRLANYLG